MGAHLRISRESVNRPSQMAAPMNLHRNVVAVHDRVEDVELLRPQRLLPLLGVSQNPVQLAMHPDWLPALGEFFLDDVLGEEFREGASFRAVLNGFEVPARDCEIVGRGDRHDSISEFRVSYTGRIGSVRSRLRGFPHSRMYNRHKAFARNLSDDVIEATAQRVY